MQKKFWYFFALKAKYPKGIKKSTEYAKVPKKCKKYLKTQKMQKKTTNYYQKYHDLKKIQKL